MVRLKSRGRATTPDDVNVENKLKEAASKLESEVEKALIKLLEKKPAKAPAEGKGPHLKFDDVDLIKRVDKDNSVEEIRSVHNVSILGKRRIVELQIPGSKSNVFQDMGRIPLRISFDGELVGPGAKKTLQSIQSKFESGKPVKFSSNLTTLQNVTEVVIEAFNVNFMDGVPEGNRYSIAMKECKPSKPEEKKSDRERLVEVATERAKEEFEKRVGGMKKEKEKDKAEV